MGDETVQPSTPEGWRQKIINILWIMGGLLSLLCTTLCAYVALDTHQWIWFDFFFLLSCGGLWGVEETFRNLTGNREAAEARRQKQSSQILEFILKVINSPWYVKGIVLIVMFGIREVEPLSYVIDPVLGYFSIALILKGVFWIFYREHRNFNNSGWFAPIAIAAVIVAGISTYNVTDDWQYFQSKIYKNDVWKDYHIFFMAKDSAIALLAVTFGLKATIQIRRLSAILLPTTKMILIATIILTALFWLPDYGASLSFINPMQFFILWLFAAAIMFVCAFGGGKDEIPDQRKWFYDVNTGEFYRITSSYREQVIYDSTPYSIRLISYVENIKPFYGYLIATVLFSAATWYIIEYSSEHIGHPEARVGILVMATGLFGLGTAFMTFNYFGMLIRTRARIGPKPRPVTRDDFGAARPETPTNHPAQDNLTYKPAGGESSLGYMPNA